MVKRRAYFIDADYIIKKNQTYVRLLVKGKKTTRLYLREDPYFYADAPESKLKDLEKIIGRAKNGETVTPLKVELVKKDLFGEDKKLIKIYCKKPPDVPVLRESIPFTCYEHRIPFARRFIIDYQLTPFSIITYEREGRLIKKITKIEEGKPPELSCLAFDIETYNPLGAPREGKDPAIMISYYSPEREGVLTYKKINKKFVKAVEDEKTMISDFVGLVKDLNPDLIFGYNSANFDLPYLNARAQKFRIPFALGRGNKPIKKIKKGLISGIGIDGRIHLDAYPAARFFGFIGLIKARSFTLETIYHEITGKSKRMVKRLNIWEMWDKNELDELAEYSLMDSKATYEVGQFVMPLQIELSSITKMSLFDVSLSTSGQLVESLLMFNAFKRNEIVPSKPSDVAVKERERNPIQGAFVKLPAPGIYENIAVMDFRGLYPSIIISYNIDPFTIVKSDGYRSPTGTHFSKKKKGIIPETLDYLVEYRTKIKHQLKKLDKDSEEYKRMNARQWALKILANSFYGYLAYPRSRWYNRECGESTTAWGRKHIEQTIEEAGKVGFSVLYGDTDSVFLVLGKKTKEDVLKFMEKVNKELPEKMELELEGFYSRGVFVSKKDGEEKGAKKKYALLGEDGRIKIKGFELVRRDWSAIAKETQLNVLEAILKDGSKEKAIKIVRETIERVRSGKVPLEELAINTQLNKNPAKYEVASPELSAAVKGVKHGIPLEKGSIVSFVITKSGKSISEKAEMVEFAKDYDPDYYINHQILPSVLKILKELGTDEHELKFGGKQKSLDSFF